MLLFSYEKWKKRTHLSIPAVGSEETALADGSGLEMLEEEGGGGLVGSHDAWRRRGARGSGRDRGRGGRGFHRGGMPRSMHDRGDTIHEDGMSEEDQDQDATKRSRSRSRRGGRGGGMKRGRSMTDHSFEENDAPPSKKVSCCCSLSLSVSSKLSSICV